MPANLLTVGTVWTVNEVLGNLYPFIDGPHCRVILHSLGFTTLLFFQSFVPLSLLLVGMARGQEDIDAASLNEILPEGYTKVCLDDEEGGAPRGKRQVGGGDGPPPCWSLVDKDFDRKECSSFEGKCSKEKPYVGTGNSTMCIFFPQASKWFKLGGSYGWCGADNCCDFHPKGQCNPPR